jgi:hypothetical protein
MPQPLLNFNGLNASDPKAQKPTGPNWTDYVATGAKVIAQEAPKIAFNAVVDNYKAPPYKQANTGIDREVAGEGTGSASDWINYLADRGNDITSYTKWGQAQAAKANPKSLFGMGGSLVDSRFLKNRGMGANIATGFAVGIGSEIAGELVNDSLAGDDAMKGYQRDLADAEFYQDDETKARIFAAMNSAKNAGKDAKILAHGASTGSALGPKGAALGLGAAGAVVTARKFSPDNHHDYDPKFAAESRLRHAEANKKAVSEFRQDDAYYNVADAVLEQARRVSSGELSLDNFDTETADQIIRNAVDENGKIRPNVTKESFKRAAMLIQTMNSEPRNPQRTGRKELSEKYKPSDPYEYLSYSF